MTRIAVIGPGAIGGTVAAWLAQSDLLTVTLCARTALTTLTVETPGGTIGAALSTLVEPAEAEVADWVLVCTKTYDAPGAAVWLQRLVGPETRVAVLQNGIEHRERFAPWVPAERIVPAVVDIPAERRGPGEVLQRRDGTIVVPSGADGDGFVALFGHTPIAVSTTDDFQTAAWGKLALNCAGAVNALALKPAGVAAHEGAGEVMRGLVAECVAVGRAEGAMLDEELPDSVVEGYRSGAPDSVNSLLADRLAGRRMEWDARNGVIVRFGRRHGIDTPVNRAVAALLSASEEG